MMSDRLMRKEMKRFRAMKLVFEGGYTQKAAAQRLGVHLRSVQRWVHLYRTSGESGLHSKIPTGRPRKLNPKQLNIIGNILLRGAKAQGYSNDLWTSKRIVKLIHTLTNVEYHPNHIPKLLRSMGWSSQRPQKIALEKDPKKIDEWIRVEWKQIKKKPKKRRQR